jgi:hypothetical protein
MIETGEVKNQSAVARNLGVSRTHVCQVLILLKLDDELIKTIRKLGNPIPTGIVTERLLRGCLKHHENCEYVQARLGD